MCRMYNSYNGDKAGPNVYTNFKEEREEGGNETKSQRMHMDALYRSRHAVLCINSSHIRSVMKSQTRLNEVESNN